jgi:hypothetical protein
MLGRLAAEVEMEVLVWIVEVGNGSRVTPPSRHVRSGKVR